MNNEVLAKRIKADGMKLEYRSELAITSGENFIYKTLLAYADVINDFMLDGRTFKYTPEQVIDYISTMSGCMIHQINKIRGISDEEFISNIFDNISKEIPEYIKEQFDQMPDEPWPDYEFMTAEELGYEEDDEDEE